MRSSSISRGGLLLLAAAQLSSAHTWIEQLMVIAPNGTMVGAPGYARGNVLRSDPQFTGAGGDTLMVHLMPPNGGRAANDLRATDLICMSSQTSQEQTNGSPRLQAPAGAAIALRYAENGHVSLPENQPGKPQNRGTNYVYGTSKSSPDDALLAVHRQWTPDGSGGDGRGALISTQNFDDGQCHENNNSPIAAQRKQVDHQDTGLLCQQDIALPSTLKAGDVYTLYWVWDWPTMPGTAGAPQGKQEIYTTCMDIDIVDNSLVEPISKASAAYAAGQDYAHAAASAQFADITNPTAVANPQTIAFSASAAGPASGQAATESASPTTTDDSFLSVHTTSTFSVIPIGGTIPTAAPAASTAPSAALPTDAPQTTSQPSSDGQSGGSQGGQGGRGGGTGGHGFGGDGSGMPPFPTNGTGRPPFPFPSGSGRPPGLPAGFPVPSGFKSRLQRPTGQFGDGTATAVQFGGQPMSTMTMYDTTTAFVTSTIFENEKRTSELPPFETASETSQPSSSLTSAESSTSETSVPEASPQTLYLKSSTSAEPPLPTYSAPSASSSDSLTIVDLVSAPAEATTAVEKRAEPSCSRQHPAFRLRARLPFVKNFLDQADGQEC